ncbi:hypothetical protein BaRGS_00019696 [Batillaria attramentaria]|uniref:Sulfatase N-terminal domain-containing protein n=1 Tax=Batillaria attramentaria TaxID=370345 RepID=A0ABD0KPQ8_9CAEN
MPHVSATCQAAIFKKVHEQNVASVTEANGERTVTPTDPTAVFKVVYEVDPKETATFTRVTYRVNGAAPQSVYTNVFNHPDQTNTGSIYDNAFTVGQNKVKDFPPQTAGNRIRFTVTPESGTTAIELVIVSIEACLGTTGEADALTTWLTNAPTSKPNVLFMVSDDLRPWMGCYGVDFMVTPNLDLLASKSVRFDSAYVQHAVCGPSRASFMTGRRSESTRVMDLHTYWRTAGGNFTTVSQYFKDNGYLAEGVGKIYHKGVAGGDTNDYPYSWSTPLDRSDPTLEFSDSMFPFCRYCRSVILMTSFVDCSTFLVMDQTPVYPAEAISNSKAQTVRPVEETGGVLQDTRIADNAVTKLQEYAQNPDQPFFLAVGFLKPHLPFLFPEQYMDLYPNPMDIPLAVNRDINTNLPSIVWTKFGELQKYGDIAALNLSAENNYRIADDKQYELRRGYAAATSYIDAMVGKVLQGLNDNGLASNTIIVFFSDHGFQLGENGQWTKHNNYETSVRIPFLLRVPGVTDNNDGFQSIDLFNYTPQDYGRRLRAVAWRGRTWRSVSIPGTGLLMADWNKINTRELYIHDVDENGSDVDVEEHFNQVDNPNYSGVVAELAQKLRENWFVALQDYHNQGQN